MQDESGFVMDYLRTSDLARAVGIHPNTVRRYVEWGLLPPVQRGPNGYRRFTQHHLDCLCLARMIYTAAYPGKIIRLSGNSIIQRAVADDWSGALECGYAYLTLVKSEQAQAETAASMLEQWAANRVTDSTEPPMQIGPAARLLGVSIDMLRNWERNGLIAIPRTKGNQYRAYGPAQINRLRVIRMLGQAGYSQMAILRMLIQLDRGNRSDLRRTLDTPAPDEDVYTASDRWLSTLAAQEQVAQQVIAFIQAVINARA